MRWARRYVNLHFINTVGVLDRVACVECRCPGLPPGVSPRGGVVCCRNCASASAAPPLDYALQYSTIFRRARTEAAAGRMGAVARIDRRFVGMGQLCLCAA